MGLRGIEVASAGTNHDAENPLTDELIRWADIIVVMERMHRSKVRFDIPDRYRFMDPALIDLLEARMARHFPVA